MQQLYLIILFLTCTVYETSQNTSVLWRVLAYSEGDGSVLIRAAVIGCLRGDGVSSRCLSLLFLLCWWACLSVFRF